MVGATAALAGLVIVASSVNIAEIIKANTITSRLGAAIASLVLALAVSGFALVPDIPAIAYGIATLVATAGAGSFQVHSAIVIARDPAPEAHARFAKAALGFLPIVAYLATGVLAFVDPAAALVAAGLGCITAIAAAIVVSWVALVEVLR